jgi:Holliday junction resolvasome RuvABC endonuclease subunit
MDSKDIEYHIGIDPGWKNLGLAVLTKNLETNEIKLVKSKVFNVSEFGSISKFVDVLDEFITPLILHVDSVTIERYVTYAGVNTAESENICMVIGALTYYFAGSLSWGKEPLLVRAIDWKTTLVKTLVKKKKFDNPSDKLDKKFSIAAAKACLDEEVKFDTDHEADAICLAAYQPLTKKDK